jgi:uncharacterized protein YjiS (DUF1127 family)
MSYFQYLSTSQNAGEELRRWAADGLPNRFAPGPVFGMLATWVGRARMRRHLSRMDDRLLRDIGLSRLDAKREINKPFWRE